MSPDELGIQYTETAVSLVRGLQLLMGAFVAFRLGTVLRARGRSDGMLRGLGYGLLYIAVSTGIVEASFLVVGEDTTQSTAATVAVLAFVIATAAAGGSVFGLWHRFDAEP